MAQLTSAEKAQRHAQLLALLVPIHDPARRTARRLCACAADGDDLFQEAVLRAFFHLPTLRDPARFSGWFYAVMLSVHRARSRVSFWRRFLPLDAEPAGQAGGGFSPALAEQTRDRAQRLAKALKTLPAEQREAVVLFEVEGFSLEEIAGMQGASVTAVKTRLHRGRQRLRRQYEELGVEFATEPAPPAAARGQSPEPIPGVPSPALPASGRPTKEVCHG